MEAESNISKSNTILSKLPKISTISLDYFHDTDIMNQHASLSALCKCYNPCKK